MSQALIDLAISHEVQNYTDAKVHTITVQNRELFCVKMIDVQKGLGIQNISDLVRKNIEGIYETKDFTKKQKRKYIRAEQEISQKPIDDFKIKYVRSDLMEKIIKNFGGVKKCNDGINRIEKEGRRENFRATLNFKEHDIMLTKEQSILKSVMDAFEGENMQTQYSVLGYKIDLYFHEYKLAIEVDEKVHKVRNIDHEIKRQNALEKEFICKFIRINSDQKDFNIFKTINEIHRKIKKLHEKSTEKSTKKSLIDEISNNLLRVPKK